MNNEINLDNFSAKKYKSEIYQLRLKSYIGKSEDFEEIDFIGNEQKYFNGCLNSVDENRYNSDLVCWYELEGEMDYGVYYDLKPDIDPVTYQYFSKNQSEQERLIKTFSLILQFLSEQEILYNKTQSKKSVPLTLTPINLKEPTDPTPFVKNNFDHVPIKNVYDYFKKELVDTNYLSLEDLEKYLVMAFQNKNVSAERFTITYKKSPTPTKIKKIFYKYYNEIAQDKHGKMKDYCGLLGEYFNGFDTGKISRNFNR